LHTLADFRQIWRAVRTYYGALTVQFLERLDKEQKSYQQFSKIKSSIFGNAYRVNHLKESLQNWYKDKVINVVQTFCGLKQIRIIVVEL